MNDEHRAVIRSLVNAYLPHFERNDVPTMDPDNFFMRFLDQAEKDDVLNDDYVSILDRLGGWETLKDLELIKGAGIDEVRALLTAAFRSSEHRGTCNDINSIWREYAQAGTFTAILRRLDVLEKKG